MKFPVAPRASLCLIFVLGSGSLASAEEAFSHGDDITRPVDRFDLRMQFESLPSQPGFDDLSTETLTLRTDLLLFNKPDQLALRFDLPLVWTNKPEKDNPGGDTDFGLGDILMQAVYVREIDSRWAAGFGAKTYLPTATGDGEGTGKWQLVPTAAVRADLPEISPGSYAGLIVRQYNSVAGPASRKNINRTSVEPQLNIGLPDQWFLNFSPELIYDRTSADWFVPLDVMVGRKFGDRWVASVEYQYGLVTDYDKFDNWIEVRLGYYF